MGTRTEYRVQYASRTPWNQLGKAFSPERRSCSATLRSTASTFLYVVGPLMLLASRDTYRGVSLVALLLRVSYRGLAEVLLARFCGGTVRCWGDHVCLIFLRCCLGSRRGCTIDFVITRRDKGRLEGGSEAVLPGLRFAFRDSKC